MKIRYKLIAFVSLLQLFGCSTSYEIKEGASKAQLDVDISNLGKKTGLSSVFSGSGYRLELHSYDITKCELDGRVIGVNPFDLDESIEIPAEEPLYLFYFYTAIQSYGSRFEKGTCARPIGFLPVANHRYKFDFKLEPTRCRVRIIDVTNPRQKPTMIRMPKTCLEKRHPIQ